MKWYHNIWNFHYIPSILAKEKPASWYLVENITHWLTSRSKPNLQESLLVTSSFFNHVHLVNGDANWFICAASSDRRPPNVFIAKPEHNILTTLSTTPHLPLLKPSPKQTPSCQQPEKTYHMRASSSSKPLLKSSRSSSSSKPLLSSSRASSSSKPLLKSSRASPSSKPLLKSSPNQNPSRQQILNPKKEQEKYPSLNYTLQNPRNAQFNSYFTPPHQIRSIEGKKVPKDTCYNLYMDPVLPDHILFNIESYSWTHIPWSSRCMRL